MQIVGIDVGGTHTDLFAWSGTEGKSAKVPSTPANPSTGVLNALDDAGIDPADIEYFLHGSTITTNAVIERSYPKTAFVTTEGFRDLIEIGRYHREELYNPYQEKPDPLVPRRDRYTVVERVDASGGVESPLDEEQVRELIDTLDSQNYESVAIGFVNAYENGIHEKTVEDCLESELDVTVARSSAVSPKMGTLERFNTTIVNAALSPLMVDYIDDLRKQLAMNGFNGQFSVIKSNGGLMNAEQSKQMVERTVLSGPAAGARGAGYVGESVGKSNVIGMDMGGTSTDVSLIEDGNPLVTTDYEIEFDIPLSVPMIDVSTIGAGGGTIAWIDEGGSLRVGPDSAGADPGPACYPSGGNEPTITDANFLLGRLHSENFLGGTVSLERERAHAAVEELADSLGLGVVETATGILEIATENMAAAIRETTIDRGRDPRDYYLIGFGGCGPMHAAEVADSLGIPTVTIPANSGVLSAFAGTEMDIQYDQEMSYMAPVAEIDTASLNGELAMLEKDVRDLMERNESGVESTEVTRIAEMRYVGQTYELDVPIPSGNVDAAALEKMVEEFHEIHEREYGVKSDEFDIEMVNLRVSLAGEYAETEVGASDEGQLQVTDVGPVDTRDVYFDGEWRSTDIYARSNLVPGESVSGPAIIEDPTTTVVVHPEMAVERDNKNNVIITISED